jgi:D-beta-D-heptose 7-phosphate kinase / D-beta-D-heptose 1-phosphate adenosyltransferase
LTNPNELLKRFSRAKVLIIGDVMIDRYYWGEISRISPEAPVPVVALQTVSVNAGGAANVAANVFGLGAKPTLFGIVGNDAEGDLMPGVLRDAGISKFSLTKLGGRTTTVKTRIVASNQHVVRVDQETTAAISKKEVETIFPKLSRAISSSDIIVISDYAKGFLTNHLLGKIMTAARREKKMVLVDPKGKDFSKYAGATILTPNERETAEACHIDSHRQDLIDREAALLLERLKLEALLVTRGPKGMTLLRVDDKPVHLSASARKVFDVTGAGDTVIASLAVALGSGLDMVEGARFANAAAGIVVEQVGTTAITPDVFTRIETFKTRSK